MRFSDPIFRLCLARLAILSAWALLTGPIGSVQAFVPTNFKATLAATEANISVLVPFDTHQSITESAIAELDAEFFSKLTLTKPMRKAIEELVEANAEVDKDQFLSELHFDGENFVGGQARLNRLIRTIAESLRPAGDGSKPASVAGARQALGGALHTLQDFYAHSNWIELGNRGPHPDLGRPFRALDQAREDEVTCVNCTGNPTPSCPVCDANLRGGKLTSGYYGGEDRVAPNLAGTSFEPGAGKCHHGGPLDRSVPFGTVIGGINKDIPDCTWSPHSSLHSPTVAAAKEATKQYVRDIKGQITGKQLRSLLGVGNTLAIVIDTTGSMGPIIAGVKDEAISIVDKRLGTDEEPANYVLVPYNDPGFGPLTITDDPGKFKSAISSLSASGGGDCAEPGLQAVLAGLAASDEGGVLFYFTDADLKDKGLVGKARSLAKSKEITIYPVKFGRCSSTASKDSSASGGGSDSQAATSHDPLASAPSDDPDVILAGDTGGQVFNLNPGEAGQITKLADALVRTTAVRLFSVADSVSGAAKAYTVPVDSKLTQVTISVSGTTSFTVKRPNGSTVQSGDTGVNLVSVSGGVVYSIAAPAAGNWSVTISGSGAFSLIVSGESALDVTSFKFVAPGGRPGHDGFFPIEGLPPAGQPSSVLAAVTEGVSTAQFEFRSQTGDVIQRFMLARGSGVSANQFYGTVTPPAAQFLVYVTGQETGGTTYQRLVSSAIRPQTVAITAPPPQELPPGQTTTYLFKVKNLGPSDTFRFSASDEKNYVRAVSPSDFRLDSNQTLDVIVQLQPPPNAALGTSDALTVTVESTTSDSNNFAVVNSSVSGEVDLNFPILRSGVDFFTGVTFLNLGTESANLSMQAYRDTGDALGGAGVKNPFATTLGPSAQLPRLAPELFNLGTAGSEGWIQVHADKSTVVGFELLGNAGVLDGVAVPPLLSPSIVLTDIEYDSAYTTEVHLANSANSSNKVVLELRNSSGTPAGSFETTLAAKGKLTRRIEALFPSIPRPFTGYLIARGDGDLTGAELLVSDSAMAALNGQILQEGSSTATRLYSAQLATGRGLFFTRLNLVNPTSRTASLTLRAVGDTGASLASPASLTLSPGQQSLREVAQIFGFSAGTLTSGSLIIESNVSGILGDISFGDPSANSFRASLPLDSAPSRFAAFAHVANAAGFYTGVAAFNSGLAAANVDVKVFRSDAGQVGVSRLVIPSSGRVSKLLIEVVSASAGQAGGYFTLESDQPISAFALFGSASPMALSAIPAQRPLSLVEGLPVVVNPLPAVSSLSPSSATAGGAAFALSVNGTDFNSSSIVRWNGSVRTTTFGSSTQLRAAIPAGDIAAAGTVAVTVSNSPPGGGTSNAVNFTISAPVAPAIDVSPASLDFGSVTVGESKDLTLTVRNTGSAVLTVSSVTSSNAQFGVTSPAIPFNVAVASAAGPGQQAVTVRFAPGSTGNQTGTLTVSSNDPARGALTVGLAGSGAAAAPAPLRADYQFQNVLSSSTAGAPALNSLGSNTFGSASVDGASRIVLRFAANDGLSLNPTSGLIPSGTYSIVVLFAFDNIGGYRRIVDFKNGASDTGLYNRDGDLHFYAVAGGTGVPIAANSFVQVVLTRDTAKNVAGYVNGVRQFSFADSGDLGLIDGNNTLRFFRDNTLGGTTTEASAGSVARIRLYGGALSSSEVAALDRLPGGAAAPVIDVSPARLDFGAVTLGQAKDLTFTIRNAGGGTLTVTGILSSSAQFSIVTPAVPFSVAAGGQQSVTVRYTPASAVNQSATLTVSSNDPGGVATVNLSGMGIVGTPPTISAVSVTKLSNDVAAIDVQFTDPDGDVARIEYTFLRAGSAQSVRVITSPTDVDLTGQTAATVNRTFTGIGITTPFGVVSPDQVDVEATDSKGLKSNKVSRMY